MGNMRFEFQVGEYKKCGLLARNTMQSGG